ncbi:MAG: hypothetical protein AAF985_12870 [Bacteroidota bacterium]
MKQIFAKLILALFFTLAAWTNAYTQWSIKTGYSFNYSNPKTLNSILRTFNANNSLDTAPFSDLHISHGLQLGLRYEWSAVAIELDWFNRFRDLSTEILEAGSQIENKLFYRVNTISGGLENHYGSIAYGAKLNFNFNATKQRIGSNNNRVTIWKENNWSTQLYLSFNTSRSDHLRLSLRPFVEIPINSLNLNDLDQKLNNTNNTEVKKENALIFGVKLLFING